MLDSSLPQTKLLLNLCKQLKLVQLVPSPTRIENGATSLLDVIITNKVLCLRGTSQLPCSRSDHHMVITHFVPHGIKITRPHKYIKCRSYCNLDEEMVLKALDVERIWEDVLSFDELDDCFNRVVTGFMDMICPSKWL